jgi:hypothetical protein
MWYQSSTVSYQDLTKQNMPKRTAILEMRRKDRELLKELENKAPTPSKKTSFRNGEVRKILRDKDSYRGLLALERMARQRGCFSIQLRRKNWIDSDGEKYRFTAARATNTDMWPMGIHYWVRDNALIGARYLFSGQRTKEPVGKALLMSGLTFMSSVAQLRRFEEIIRSDSRSFIENPHNWPYIFAAVKDNLNAGREEKWAHKQDAWQIVAWYVLEGLERGLISMHELSAKHRAFFGLIVPFLIKVSFWKCENSGSWEEILAVRTSVRAWEHRLVVLLGELSSRREFSFLKVDFRAVRAYLGRAYAKKDLPGAVATLDRITTRLMLGDLPFESPSYPRTDPRYREADAALIYLLQIEYLDFLALRVKKHPKWKISMEKKLLGLLARLDDPKTGGIARYENDYYQRSGFFRNLTVRGLKDLYGAPSGDASAHFAGREKIVPKGRKAMWTHFVWQLAAWSGRRSLEDPDVRFRELHEFFFARGLALITGEQEVSLDVDKRGFTQVIRIPGWRMPECYISDRTPSKGVLVFPSPHTPLNWAVAEMEEAFRVRKLVLSGSVGL